MNVFTVSADFIKNIQRDSLFYFADVLFLFPQTYNDYKVAVDSKGVVLEIYEKIDTNKEFIKVWLDLLANNRGSMEVIDANIEAIPDDYKKFLKLCIETNGSSQLIVYSKQSLKQYPVSGDRVSFEGFEIILFDRDQIRSHLNQKVTNQINISGSQIATQGSSIVKSNNQ